MKFKRLVSVCAVALSSFGPLSAAHAAYNGTPLSGREVPAWAVGNSSCQGTLILPGVVISADCLSGLDRTDFFVRRDGRRFFGSAFRPRPAHAPLGDLSVVILDPEMAKDVALVPSYWSERVLLRPGRRLTVYASDHDAAGDGYKHAARRVETFRNLWPAQRDAPPLVYHRIGKIRKEHSGMITPDGWPLFTAEQSEGLLTKPEADGGLHMEDEDIDDSLILMALDPAAARSWRTPIGTGDSGSGIFVRGSWGQDWFVGVASSVRAHARASLYWPWVYRTLMAQGARSQAIALAKRVLNPWERVARRERGLGELAAVMAPDRMSFGDFDRRGVIGSIFPYDNPRSGQVEFYRLVQLDAQGRYADLPTGSRDGRGWEYLGTDLPTQAEATVKIWEWTQGDDAADVGDVFVRVDPVTERVAYFRLASLDASGTYGPMPTNGTDSMQWTYLGEDVPVRRSRYQP